MMAVQNLLPFGLHIKCEVNEPVQCDTCVKQFNHVEEFTFHRVIYHSNFHCSICDNSFENINERNEHELYRHYPLKCFNCNESFMCNQLLNKHILILHDCKVCDFCLEKVHPKDEYLDHLSSHHKIKSTLHYSEVNGSYLILDAQDEINFHCKLCNEVYPIEMFYIHFTVIHSFKVRILLNIINKMSIEEYLKTGLMVLSQSSENDIKGHNQLFNFTSATDASNVKNMLSKAASICTTCNNVFNADMPKEFHDIYCNGQYHCKECNLIFKSLEEKKSHIDNDHFVHCPLGCYDLELATGDLKDHCMDVHSIVICNYCGVFVSSINQWFNDHLAIEHNYGTDINNYNNNTLLLVKGSNVVCALCQNYLTSIVNDLEKIITHYLSLHNLCIKNLENLLVKNPLMAIDSSKISNHFRYNTEKVINDNIVLQIRNIENQLGKTATETESSLRANYELLSNKLNKETIKLEVEENLSYDCSKKIESKEDQNLHILPTESKTNLIESDSIKNVNNSGKKKLIKPYVDDLDLDGYNDINFSEVQCVFSDTSDDAMSDSEIIKSPKKGKSRKNVNDNSKNIREFIFTSKEFIQNDELLMKARFIMKCEVCLNDFEKRDKYAKHLEKLHGFQCFENVNEITKKDSKHKETLEIKSDEQKPSKYISVIKKVRNPLYLCLICKTETTSKTLARKHFRTHNFWTTAKCDSSDIGYKCRFCSNLFWTVEKRNKHQIVKHLATNDKQKVMKCYVCTTIFSSKTCLKRHVRVEHDGYSFTTISYKCLHCCKLYPNLSEVRQHFEKDHPSSKSLYCSLAKCRTKCSSKQVLKSHYKRLHIDSEQFPRKCELCDKSLISRHSMQLHMKIKHGEHKPGFKCRACEKCFKTEMERKAHMQAEHPGVATYFCKLCNKGFRTKSSLNGHVQMHKEINHSCPHCEKKFTRRDSYLEHLLIHSGPRHKCNVCEKEFVQRSNLVRHTRTHTGDKPYFCRYCFKRFADKGACNSHERVHTREEVSACPYCNQTFSKKQKLKYHIRKHTGQGLEKCDVCEKNFTSAYSLKKHMEIHERRAIKCTCECGKSFTCEEYLQRHMRVTHGKPRLHKLGGVNLFSFYCQVCPQGYNTKAKLNDHVITHSSYQNVKCSLCDFKTNMKKIIREHLTTNHGIPDQDHGSCYELIQDDCTDFISDEVDNQQNDNGVKSDRIEQFPEENDPLKLPL